MKKLVVLSGAGISVERGAGGSVTIHAVVDGLTEKYVFTPI